MSIDNASSEVFTILQGGEVGIGTASEHTWPVYNLDITGASSAWIGLRQQYGSFSIGNSDINDDGTKNYSIYDLDGSSHRLIISSEGNIGMGGGCPNIPLTALDIVDGTTNANQIYVNKLYLCQKCN